jgi:polynucleotide 5'-kinase involved in rRNA processing
MLPFQSLKTELQQINNETTTFLERVLDLPGTPVETFQSWRDICETIERQVAEDVIRVAVVGAIKSGKAPLSIRFSKRTT